MSACRIRETNERKVLVWSKESRYRPSVRHTIVRLATDAQNLPFHEITNGSGGRSAAKEGPTLQTENVRVGTARCDQGRRDDDHTLPNWPLRQTRSDGGSFNHLGMSRAQVVSQSPQTWDEEKEGAPRPERHSLP